VKFTHAGSVKIHVSLAAHDEMERKLGVDYNTDDDGDLSDTESLPGSDVDSDSGVGSATALVTFSCILFLLLLR
jgi:hypothetical protein